MLPPLEIPHRNAPSAIHYSWAALGIFLLTVYGSLLPFEYTYRPLEGAIAAFRKIELHDPSDLEARGDWIISTVLFAALSFLLMAAMSVDRPRWTGMLNACGVLAACFALSVTIEFVQLYFPPRTVSLNDILMESLGGVAGVSVWLLGGQRITGWLRRLGKVTTVSGLAARLLPGYVTALLIVQLMPFDFVVNFDELAVKYAEGKIRPIPWNNVQFDEGWDTIAKAALNLACFLPLGFLQAVAERRGNTTRSRTALPWAAFLAPIVVEFLQLFIYSRSCDSADIVTGILGVYFGWLLGLSIGRSYRPPAMTSARAKIVLKATGVLVLLAWLVAVAYLYWRPFDFTADPAQFSSDRSRFQLYGFRRLTLAPFVDYYWGSKYNALDQFARKALSFVPLGVLWAFSLRNLYKRGATAWMLLSAFAIALILEGGRYFLPSHSPSTTDVFIACAGAWLGFWLTRRFRVVLWAEDALYSWLRPSSAVNLPRLKSISSV